MELALGLVGLASQAAAQGSIDVQHPFVYAAAGLCPIRLIDSASQLVPFRARLIIFQTLDDGDWPVQTTIVDKQTIGVRVDTIGKLTLITEAGDTFRFVAIPMPVEIGVGRWGGGRSSSVDEAEFRAQCMLRARVTGFDCDATCPILGYIIRRRNKYGTKQSVTHLGAQYSPEAQRLFREATPGDIYTFDHIRYRCPGAPAPQDGGKWYIRFGSGVGQTRHRQNYCLAARLPFQDLTVAVARTIFALSA